MPVQVKDEDLHAAENKTFGPTEERAIISLAFDQPEFFSSLIKFLKPQFFEQTDSTIVFAIIKYHWDKHSVILTRDMCRDIYASEKTADDPYKEIIELIYRESNPRDVPVIIDRLAEWAKKKQYAELYSEEVYSAHLRGEYEVVETIIEDARKITTNSTQCHFFFNDTDAFFEPDNEIRLTTGFPELDRHINEGGPVKGDVFCWMAPTGVGKSIALINNAAACIKRKLNVLFITLEMRWFKVGLRFLGCFTEFPIKQRIRFKSEIYAKLNAIKATYGAELIVAEFPPDEISVDNIHALLDAIRKVHGIKIDVVCIDYLELMMSRHAAYNKEEYIRQKRVSTEICRLAVKEDVLVFTASQTNRSGNDGQDEKGRAKPIDLNKTAESYGKNMPLSYVVTINQTKNQYHGILTVTKKKDKDEKTSAASAKSAPVQASASEPEPVEEEKRSTSAVCDFYIAKNRNGPKFEHVTVRVNYETMKMKEHDFHGPPVNQFKQSKEIVTEDATNR